MALSPDHSKSEKKKHHDKSPSDQSKKGDQGIISKLPPADKIKPDSKQAEAGSAAAPKIDIPSPPQKQQDGGAPPAPAPAPAAGGDESGGMVQMGGGMVQMGGGLPALPPRPPVPQRQANPSASVSSAFIIPQRVPNLKQASKPQLNIPPGSDLGAVGKIGVFQMSHRSSAADIHANVFFWVYVLTFIVTFVLIKRK